MKQRQAAKQRPTAKQHSSPERNAQTGKRSQAAPLNPTYDQYLRSFVQSSLEQPRSHHASFSGSPASLQQHSPQIDPQVVRVLEDSQMQRNQLIYSILNRTQSAQPSVIGAQSQYPDILRRLSLVEKRLGIPQAPPYQQSAAALQVKALMRANLRIRLLKYYIARQQDKIDVYNMQIARLREESNGGLSECRNRLSGIEKQLAELSAGFFEIQKGIGNYQVYQIATLEAKQNKIIQIIRSQKDAIQQYIERQDAFNTTYQENGKEVADLIETKTGETAYQIAEVKHQLLQLQEQKTNYAADSTNCEKGAYDGLTALQQEVSKLRMENTNILVLLNQYRKASYSAGGANAYALVLSAVYSQMDYLKQRIAGLEDRSTESELSGIERDISNIVEAVGENQTQIVDLSAEIQQLGAVSEDLANRLKVCEQYANNNSASALRQYEMEARLTEFEEQLAELEDAAKPPQSNVSGEFQMQLALDELSKQIGMLTVEQVRLRERQDACSAAVYDEAACREPTRLEQYFQEQVAYVVNYISALRAEVYARLAAFESGRAEGSTSVAEAPSSAADKLKAGTALNEQLTQVAYKLAELRDALAGMRDQMQQNMQSGQKCSTAISELQAQMQALSSSQSICNVENIAQQIGTLFDAQKDSQEQIAELERQIGFVYQFLMTGLAQGEEMSEEQRSESQ